MLKIVNQTTMTLGYDVERSLPTSQNIARGVLEPNQIATFRVDNDPQNYSKASNCRVSIYKGDPRKPDPVYLEAVACPGNATVVFSTQIITGLLQPGS